MDTQDQVVPGEWTDPHSGALPETFHPPQATGSDTPTLPEPLYTSTPELRPGDRTQREASLHRDSGYTSPPPHLAETLGPNSPENTDIDGRLIQRFTFSEQAEDNESEAEGSVSECVSEDEDSAFLEHQEPQDMIEMFVGDGAHSSESQDMLLGPSQERLGSASESVSDRLNGSSHEDTGSSVLRFPLNRTENSPHETGQMSHVSSAPFSASFGGITNSFTPSDYEYTDASEDRPLFFVSSNPSLEQGVRSVGRTAAIPVPMRSHISLPQNMSRYMDASHGTSVFHTPPREYMLRRAGNLVLAQGGAGGHTSGTQMNTTGLNVLGNFRPVAGAERAEATLGHRVPVSRARARAYSEYQAPPSVASDPSPSLHNGDTTPERRRSAPAIMYAAQLFGQELRRIGDEFEGTYSQPGAAEANQGLVRATDGNVNRERQDASQQLANRPNRRSFPGANHQEARWWEKIIQFLPITSPTRQPIGRHRTEPSSLCGRVTEENSEEEESEGSADDTMAGHTEV